MGECEVTGMRTILALDEMLGREVAKQLPGVSEVCGRIRMRDDGDDVVRELVLHSPSVLAIGAKGWNPLDLLERWRLPYEVPVVLVVPSLSWDDEVRATRLDVFSVVPADRSVPRMATCLACECRLAWAWTQRRFGRPPRQAFDQPHTAPVSQLGEPG